MERLKNYARTTWQYAKDHKGVLITAGTAIVAVAGTLVGGKMAGYSITRTR